MDQKTVALQLRTLASDPDNQTYIVREKGCMKGLMGFLDSPNDEVKIISLQALKFLSSHPSNKELLAKDTTLLGKLINFSDDDNEHINTISNDILENLEDYINGSSTKKAAPQAEAVPKKAPVSSFKPRYLYGIPLQVEGLISKASCDRVEKQLLGTQGVVSITVEQDIGQVTVYTRAAEADIVDSLVAAVKNAGFRAVPGQGQKDTKPQYQQATNNENAARNHPGYLTPASMKQYREGSLTEYAGSVKQNSLEARLRKKREQQEANKKKQGKVRSVFSTVTSYFW